MSNCKHDERYLYDVPRGDEDLGQVCLVCSHERAALVNESFIQRAGEMLAERDELQRQAKAREDQIEAQELIVAEGCACVIDPTAEKPLDSCEYHARLERERDEAQAGYERVNHKRGLELEARTKDLLELRELRAEVERVREEVGGARDDALRHEKWAHERAAELEAEVERLKTDALNAMPRHGAQHRRLIEAERELAKLRAAQEKAEEPAAHSHQRYHEVTFAALDSEIAKMRAALDNSQHINRSWIADWETIAEAAGEATDIMVWSLGERIRNMRSELAEARAAQEWQPMETAPRDGTRVLIGLTSDARWVTGSWLQEFELWTVPYLGGFQEHLVFGWQLLPAGPASEAPEDNS